MQNNYRERRAPIQGDYYRSHEEQSGRKYELEYVYNGFWFGGFKKAKIESIINNRIRKGWKLVDMESHSSIFLLFFRRTSIVLVFYHD